VRTAAALVILLSVPSAFGWTGCGIIFSLPTGWDARITSDVARYECEIGVRPHRNDLDPFAFFVTVYRIPFEDAASECSLEKSDQGAWKASPVRFGKFHGWHARVPALGSDSTYLLDDADGTIVGLQYSPDVPGDPDRDAAARKILGSLHPVAPTLVRSTTCGAEFFIPRPWSASREGPDAVKSDTADCHIALRPRGWSERAKHSRWGSPDPPLTLILFSRSKTFDQALEEIGFDNDEERGLGMWGGYGSRAGAAEYKAGPLTGLAASTFFRGFIRDEALLRAEESRVFSGEIGHIVLKTRSGRPIGFVCDGGSPDDEVDCAPVIERIARTIRFIPRKD
jgi:hypothetical protein